MTEMMAEWDTMERLDLVRNGKWHWLLDGFSQDYLTLAERNWYEDRYGLHPKEIQYRLERKLNQEDKKPLSVFALCGAMGK